MPFKHLFIDDRWIETTHAVHRRIGIPEKHPANPLLVADQPWERGVKLYGTVLRDGERYRMWYQLIAFGAEDPRFVTGVGYAESRDGIRWRKPLEGVSHPVHGPTNLVVLSSGRTHLCSPSVVLDEAASDPRRRYRMMFFDAMSEEDLEHLGSPFPPSPTVPGWQGIEGEGMFVCHSADGLRWERPARPVFAGPSDVASMSRREDGTLLAAHKTSTRAERHFRVIETAASADGERWSSDGVVLAPDWRDAVGTEFYGMSAFEYAGNLIGLICVYHNSPDDKRLDIQLATGAADGTWKRAADRATLLPVGSRGSWDAGGIYVASCPVVAPPRARDRIWLYYSGISARHDDFRYKEWSIGQASLRLDGFASLVAGYFPGELRTRPFVATGEDLYLNLACRHGELRLRVLDAATGRELAASRRIVGRDSVTLKVAWRRKEPLAGREVVLEFEMTRCELYAFWMA